MSDGIDLKISNLVAFNKALNKKLQDNKVKEYVTRATLMVQNTAKQSIMAGGTGKTVQKYDPRRTHTQSAPNQPPASDTGFLVSQITMDVDVKMDGSVVGQIISSAPYSKALEFGTVNMTERPFMQPALMKNKRKIQAMFKKGILK
jgi:HK97 gp10 family phage protein